MHRKIIIGSRGSDLALWQANYVKDKLTAINVDSEIKIIKTQGDNFVNVAFNKLLGKGFFTKEIEDELLSATIDLAVHSHKDLPTENPPGLIVAAVSERENPADVLLIHPDAVDVRYEFSLRERAIVGSSSGRRRSQLKAFRPDLEMLDIRGNLPSRIQKLRDGEYDAIILAKAGLNRINADISGLHAEEFTPQDMVPAPAQGVLAIQIREFDTELATILAKIHNKKVHELISIERKILNLFEGGCQTPVGAYCAKEGKDYLVWVSKADEEDDFPLRYFVRTRDIDGLAEQIVEKYIKTEKNISSVFITRNLSENSYLQKAMNEQGIRIEGRSMIKTFPIINRLTSTSLLKHVDWIFFNSKNAVDYFFKLEPFIPKKTKIAVMGRGSERELRDNGREPDFVGDSSDTHKIAKEFAAIASNKTVIFPAAKDSLQAIQKELSKSAKIIDLPIYETVPDDEANASGADVLIFTSPSNVEAYLKPFLIDSHQKVIAIGKSTGKKLEEFGIVDYHVPYSPDEPGLAEAVFEFV